MTQNAVQMEKDGGISAAAVSTVHQNALLALLMAASAVSQATI